MKISWVAKVINEEVFAKINEIRSVLNISIDELDMFCDMMNYFVILWKEE